jgi:DNA replication protein DnaD
MQGWIKLHRKIAENPIWQDKPFSRGQAWVDLLLMANHDDNSFLFNGKLIEVEKGSFITSEHKLMDRWGWSKSKLRYFLFTLESQQMIVKITDRKKTTLTICKYCDYQLSETTEKPLKDHRKTTERPLKDLNKNEKNNKNNIYVDFFDQIWQLYPKKEGKGQVSLAQKKKLYSIGLEEITRAIDRYKKDKQGTEKQYLKNGSTFFNSGYVDYLDANYESDKPESLYQEI